MLDVGNKFLVGVQGEKIVVLNPANHLSYDDALLLAAYLVALAEPFASHKFDDVLTEVCRA